MDYPFRIPGTDGPDLVIRRSEWRGISVLLNGVKVPPSSRAGWAIPMHDGTTKALRVTGQYTGMRVLVDGAEIPLEPAIPHWMTLLMLLPGALLIGGLLGGAIGLGAIALNRVITTRRFPMPVKAVAMLVVAAAGASLWLALAVTVTPLPKLEVGQCLNGLREGANVTAANTRAVDCAKPHDNEIVGVATMDDQPAFPGDQVILIAAQAQCPPLFAAYVGIGFDASTLSMIPIVPTQTSWTAKGDRAIACVVVAGDGTKLTGSVKGTKR